MPLSHAALLDTLRSLGSLRPPAFILGSGMGCLAFLRSYGRHHIPTVALDSWRDIGMASRYAIPALIPEAEEDPEGLFQALVDMGNAAPAPGVLIPTNDAFVLFLAKHARELSKHFHLNVPAYETVQTIANKRLQYEYAQRLGVGMPLTLYPEDGDIEDVAAEMRYPCVIKPHFSHRWWESQTAEERIRWGKLGEARSPAELVATYRQMRRDGIEFVVMEKIPGANDQFYHVTTYFDRSSSPLGVFTSRKERQYPRRHGIASIMISVKEPELAELALRLLEGLRFRGQASVEFKRDPKDGRWKLIEINGRIVTYIYHATAAGIDFPMVMYRDALGGDVEDLRTFREGVKWIDLQLELKRYWAERRSGGPGLGQLLRSWRGDRCFAGYTRDDPLPALLDIWRYAFRALRERAIPT